MGEAEEAREREREREREKRRCVHVAPVQPISYSSPGFDVAPSPRTGTTFHSTASQACQQTYTLLYSHRHALTTCNSVINIGLTHLCIHVGNTRLCLSMPQRVILQTLLCVLCLFVCVCVCVCGAFWGPIGGRDAGSSGSTGQSIPRSLLPEQSVLILTSICLFI